MIAASSPRWRPYFSDLAAKLLRDGGWPATILLGGRAWHVEDVDWSKRIAWATPSEEVGRSRWAGSGAALSAQVCRAMRTVLASNETPPELTRRGIASMRVPGNSRRSDDARA